MFYEIRRYQTRPGRREEWVSYMEDVVIPFQAGQGMMIFASFVDADEPDGYIWIRRFDDEQQREKLSTAVYDSPRWRSEIGPAVTELIDVERSVITRAVPTPRSGMR